MDYPVQTPGLYNHPGFDKPIKYTADFLKSLAVEGSYILTDEHKGPEVAKFNNVYFKDNALWISLEDDIKTKNKGFSPEIKADLIDKGDYYLAVNGALQRYMALTDNPKDDSTILYNSNNHNDDNNGDGIISEEIKRLEQQIGALKSQLNAEIKKNELATEKINKLTGKKSELEQENQKLKDRITNAQQKTRSKAETLARELAGDDEALFEEIKELNPKQLRALQRREVEPLAKEIAGEEDQEAFELLKKMNKTQLQFIKERIQPQNTGFKGAGDNGAEDQNDGNKSALEEKPMSYEEYSAKTGSW